MMMMMMMMMRLLIQAVAKWPLIYHAVDDAAGDW